MPTKNLENSFKLLSVLHLNIRSLKPHFTKLEALILSLESPPEVIRLTETWLADLDSFPNYLIHGYNHLLVKNRTNPYGSVMIQVKENCTLLKEYDDDFEESITAEIALGKYKFKICVIYNKPRTNKMEFIKCLDDYLEQNTSSDMPFIICGDLNKITKEDNLMIKNYRNVISSNGFELEAEQATRITEKTSTCLDHCFHQNLFESSFELLEHEKISDHLPILLKWTTKYILCDNASQFRDTSFLKKPVLVNNYLECLKNNMNQA